MALTFVAMTETATIRVDRDVRDRLAGVAEDQGISLSELLRRYARDEFIAAERAARIADERNPQAMAEQDLWDQTLGDGID
jgi:hypothetical protein